MVFTASAGSSRASSISALLYSDTSACQAHLVGQVAPGRQLLDRRVVRVEVQHQRLVLLVQEALEQAAQRLGDADVLGQPLHLAPVLVVAGLGQHGRQLGGLEPAHAGHEPPVEEHQRAVRGLEVLETLGLLVVQRLEDDVGVGVVQPVQVHPVRPGLRVQLEESLGERLGAVEHPDAARTGEQPVLVRRLGLGDVVDEPGPVAVLRCGLEVLVHRDRALVALQRHQVSDRAEELVMLRLHRHGQHVVGVPAHDLDEALPGPHRQVDQLTDDALAEVLLHRGERGVAHHVVPCRVRRQLVALDDALEELRPRGQHVPVAGADEHPVDVHVHGAADVDVRRAAVGDAEHAADPPAGLAVRLIRIGPLEVLLDGEHVQRGLRRELPVPEVVVGEVPLLLARVAAMPRRAHRVGGLGVVVHVHRHADEVRVRPDDAFQPGTIQVAAVPRVELERDRRPGLLALRGLDRVVPAALALPAQCLVAARLGDHGDPVGDDESAEQPDAELPDQLHRPGPVRGRDLLAQLGGA